MKLPKTKNIFPVLTTRRVFYSLLIFLGWWIYQRPLGAQNVALQPSALPKRVLFLFGDAKDTVGILTLEQAVRAELQKNTTNRWEFFSESLDITHFSDEQHIAEFKRFLRSRYNETNLDLVVAFPMQRQYRTAGELPDELFPKVPVVFVTINEMEIPRDISKLGVTGIVQRHDLSGTLSLIRKLQPNTRRVVVLGGNSECDRATLWEIQENAKSLEGLEFEYWTNRPALEFPLAASQLQPDTVVLLSTIQRDVAGQRFYLSEFIKTLAPKANVPIYVLASASIGNGALGGAVVNLEQLGHRTGQLAQRVLNGAVPESIPIEEQATGTPMFDWRELQRWHIKESLLPADSVVLYRPIALWGQHRQAILISFGVFLAQAFTITGLLAQRRQRRRAEEKIIAQRTELAHLTRVSTVGQLTSALTHELNQPLGAIMRNTDTAEILLQKASPDLHELRAILADIRKDDERAGSVIERMRSLLKRRNLELRPLVLTDVLTETLALAAPDAQRRRVVLTLKTTDELPLVRGDRVHLQQVLLNLILNGMDAMAGVTKAQRQLLIQATVATDGGAEVAVSDAGPGFPADKCDRLFDPFYTTKPDGMGMGLAISKTIMEAHGGKIWAAKNPSTSGATFTFYLPAYPGNV